MKVMNIKIEENIHQIPERIFPWVAEPEKAMKWQKNVKSGEIIKKEPSIIGTTFKEEIEEDGNTLVMFGKIIKYEENKTIGFHLESKVHKFDVNYSLEATRELTRFIIEVEIHWKFPMNFVCLFIGKKIKDNLKRQLKLEVSELRKYCEDMEK